MRDARLVGGLLGGLLVALAAAAPTASGACTLNCRNDIAQASALRAGPDGRPDLVVVGATLRGTDLSYTIRRRLPCGRYTLLTRATNRAGATEARFSRRDRNRANLRLC